MKNILMSLFVLLLLSVGVKIHAQTGTWAAPFFPYTNLIQSVVIGFAQGTCNDGTNTYRINTTAIEQRNSNYQWVGGPSINKTAVTNGLPGYDGLHLGDADCYQGYLYVPMESAVGVPPGAANVGVAIFSATNLARRAVISISNYQSEASSICIDPDLSNSVVLFVSNWASSSINDQIYEYSLNNLTNLTFVRALPMTQYVRRIQGIICVNGMLYVIADNGPAGEVYQVNPTNGTTVHLAQFNIAGQQEWEGLDYFHGFLVIAEAGSGTVNTYDFFGILPATTNKQIKGFVRDNYSNPIAGVRVTASATISGTNQAVSVDTDTNGSYSLSVPNGSWSVAVDCNLGSDSLAGLGNYICPDIQSNVVAASNVTNNFVVTNCTLIISTLPALPSGESGVAYHQTLQAASCSPGYTWTIIGGSLPAGLALSSDGVLSGVPTGSTGVYIFTGQVTDGNNSTASQTFFLGISNAVQIATTELPGCVFCNVALAASNGIPRYTWSLTPGSGNLPPNLSLSTNGMLTGFATMTITIRFSVRVTDSLGATADQPLTLNLYQPLAINTSGRQLLVVWPAAASNYILQSTYDLASDNWTTITGAAPGAANIISNSAPQQYFRLH